MAFALPLVPIAIEEIVKWGAIALGAAVVGGVAANQMQQANDRSRTQTRDAPIADTCTNCRNSPCAQFANGTQGGAHGFMKGPVGDGLESHHMPAASVSPLPRDMGPAIRMSPADHASTASHASQPGGAAYRAAQGRLIQSGNFAGAFAMDVADVRAKFGNKYDVGIAEATAYMECLRRNGLVR